MNKDKSHSEKFIEAFELCSVKNIDCENCKYDKTDYCANGHIEVLEFMKIQQEEIKKQNKYIDYLKRKLDKENITYRSKL